MKRLAFFALEGLLQQGPHQVWVTLGAFPTEASAQAAAVPRARSRQGVVATRVLPLYRDSDPTACIVAHAAHEIRPPARRTAVSADSVTVA